MHITKERWSELEKVGHENAEQGLLMVLNRDFVGSHPSFEVAMDAQVHTLIANLREAQKKSRSLPDEFELADNDAFHKTLDPINRFLANHCTLMPVVGLDLRRGHGLSVRSVAHGASKSAFLVLAILRVIDLLERGELDSIRQCQNERCKKWFVAKRQRQRWCSPSCRQSAFQATDDFRIKRRNNYQAKKILKSAKLKGDINAKA